MHRRTPNHGMVILACTSLTLLFGGGLQVLFFRLPAISLARAQVNTLSTLLSHHKTPARDVRPSPNMRPRACVSFLSIIAFDPYSGYPQSWMSP